MIFIETKRLYIKSPEISDVDDQAKLQSDPDIMRFVGNGLPRTRADVEQGMRNTIGHFQRHGFGLGSVYLKDTHEFIGRAGLIHLAMNERQPEIEIGYAISKNYWGHGYASEIAQGMVDWGFKNLSVPYLLGVINAENAASRRVLEKCGMQFWKNGLYHHMPVEIYKIDRA